MMKSLKDNWNKPNDVGVIYNKNKQKRWGNGGQTTKCVKMN